MLGMRLQVVKRHLVSFVLGGLVAGGCFAMGYHVGSSMEQGREAVTQPPFVRRYADVLSESPVPALSLDSPFNEWPNPEMWGAQSSDGEIHRNMTLDRLLLAARVSHSAVFRSGEFVGSSVQPESPAGRLRGVALAHETYAAWIASRPVELSREGAVETTPWRGPVVATVASPGSPLTEAEVWLIAFEIGGAVFADFVVRTSPCESSLRPAVVVSAAPYEGWYVGLMQVWTEHGYTIAQLQDARFNIQVSYWLWQDRGRAPWPICGYR